MSLWRISSRSIIGHEVANTDYNEEIYENLHKNFTKILEDEGSAVCRRPHGFLVVTVWK